MAARGGILKLLDAYVSIGGDTSGLDKAIDDSADHALKVKNSSGTVTAAGGAGAGIALAHGCRVGRAAGNFAIGINTLTAVAFGSCCCRASRRCRDPRR